MAGELTNEVVRGITGFWVSGVDSIHLIGFHILCNTTGSGGTERSTCECCLALKVLGRKDHNDLSPSSRKPACSLAQLGCEPTLAGALSKAEITKV